MQATPLSLTARTLYAELRELALAIGATENIGALPGSIVRKILRDKVYLYHQYRDLSGVTRQTYLGPDDAATGALIARLDAHRETRAADLQRLDELRAAFLATGGTAMLHGPFRVLRAFADAGVMRPGAGHALLVGTHAFLAIGNLLGVRWAGQMMTQDIDVAAGCDIDIAVPRPGTAAPDVLDALGMGFIPVPSLDARAPSTSFRVRGQELRVDLLTPLVGKDTGQPVFVPALNAPAQALRFLDYLLDTPIPAPVFSSTGLVLVNVPRPARFALHKLIVSESRGEAFATKAEKDRQQATQVLEVLMEESPDALAAARAALMMRGKGWTDRFNRAVKKIARDYPALGALATTWTGTNGFG